MDNRAQWIQCIAENLVQDRCKISVSIFEPEIVNIETTRANVVKLVGLRLYASYCLVKQQSVLFC